MLLHVLWLLKLVMHLCGRLHRYLFSCILYSMETSCDFHSIVLTILLNRAGIWQNPEFCVVSFPRVTQWTVNLNNINNTKSSYLFWNLCVQKSTYLIYLNTVTHLIDVTVGSSGNNLLKKNCDQLENLCFNLLFRISALTSFLCKKCFMFNKLLKSN